MSDRDRILADGWERLARAVLEVQRLNDEFLVAVQVVERIRADIERQTGVSLIAPAPLHDPVVDGEFEALMMAAFFPGGMVE